MTHASLFSGIGGFDLAAEWMGWTNVFNCEWEEFPRRVLKHHFPNTEQYGDIKELDATTYAGRIDLLTGGFPCQPYSTAGKRKGKDDERHLWPEMLRVIRECTPRYVVGENVRGLVGWNGGMVFEEVCSDLEACGYAVQPFLLPAAGVGAPHRRDRVWFVAHSTSHCRGLEGPKKVGRNCVDVERKGIVGDASDTNRLRLEYTQKSRGVGQGQRKAQRCFTKSAKANGSFRDASDTNRARKRQDNGQRESRQLDQTREVRNWEDFPTVPPVCGRNDGLPKELDGITFPKWRRESIKAYGNAIVPQVALQIFKAIEQYEREILV